MLKGRVLVAGATGYVGTRLVPRLVAAGWSVRALGRSREKLAGRPWAAEPGVELVVGDVLDADALRRACVGCDAVFWLVHAMGGKGKDFADRDRRAARNLAHAAELEGVGRIVYLGGLGEDSADLSKHLKSRHEVAEVLRAGPVPVTELRAAVIIGSGSASFEILRYLTERLPVMITPKWVSTPSQPIAIRNVLEYLVGVLERPETVGEAFDIGGPDIVSYRELMELYQEEAGLRKRIIIGVPVLTPRLSSYWVHLVTPAPAALARPLAEGLRNEVIVKDHRIERLVPQDLLTPREAIRRALDLTQVGRVESHWMDAGHIPPASWSQEGDPSWTGGTILRDEREVFIDAPPATAWDPVVHIGGATGWYFADWLWRTRGRLDKFVGGVGLRRGRRDADTLQEGDALDFWRVAAVEPGRRLLLVAEMRLPGDALLEFQLEPESEGTRLRQVARFRPHGLAGMLYWYGIFPLHAWVFGGMLRGIASSARAKARPAPK